MSIMVRETMGTKAWFEAHAPTIYLGATRAKKVSDLREYDVIITTHAVRPFPDRFVTDSDPGVRHWYPSGITRTSRRTGQRKKPMLTNVRIVSTDLSSTTRTGTPLSKRRLRRRGISPVCGLLT